MSVLPALNNNSDVLDSIQTELPHITLDLWELLNNARRIVVDRFEAHKRTVLDREAAKEAKEARLLKEA